MNIKTERLCLSPIQEKDRPVLAELLTDDVVKKTYMVPDFPDREAAEGLADRLIQLSRQERPYVAGIYLGDMLTGIINETDATESEIEVGYAHLPRYHNRGYATEALRGMIRFLFDAGFSEITAGAFVENEASIRVMLKSGMELTGRRETLSYRGKKHECVFCAIRR